MKSIYVDDALHRSLKLLASLEHKKLAELVEECLNQSVRKKLSDLPAEWLERLAAEGASFEFLSAKDEDIYTDQDGAPIS